jgi:glyoxylase-like metal-dependent hydrolase (beta-lactamase superfamily II)
VLSIFKKKSLSHNSKKLETPMNAHGLKPFELFAVRYATHSGRTAAENFIGGADLHDADSDLDYYVWVARRDDEVYVIDTGFEEQAAQARGRQLITPVPEALAQMSIDTRSVRDVILTHLHYDHAGSLDQFPKATFHIQDAESAYATGRCMCHATMRQPFNVEDVVSFVRRLYAGQVKFHQGTSELVPGLTLHLIGGHTAGLQVVRVWTQRGWVVIASDASHLYGNFENRLPFPIVYNVGDMLEGHQALYQLADSPQHIIPGHDPLVMDRYPAYSTETAGVVVRVDVAPISSAN